MDKFDKSIHKVIDKFSYPIWFILKDDSVNCPCVNFTTKQADVNCKKCFGTGKKVRLRRIEAAHQNNRISIRGDGIGAGEIDVIGVYYSKHNAMAREEDLILDGDTLDVVQHAYPMRTDHSEPVYYKYETAPKKTNVALTIKNIKEVLKSAGY